MLHLIYGKDWTANREAVLWKIAEDVKQKKGGRILIVPELISHDTERRLCYAAGDTASRYAEVLSFTRLANRVADSLGFGAEECLDNGGRVVAMAAAARQLTSHLKAYASVETKPEFLTSLIDGVDEFKRCCISAEDLNRAANAAEGSLAQKLEELALLMDGYDGLCSRGKRDPRDRMVWLLEQLEESDYAGEHVFYIDGFPDFTRQNLAIIEHLIQNAPHVTVSINCDRLDTSLLAFEKAADTAREIYKIAQKAGIEVVLEEVQPKDIPLRTVRERIFQGPISFGTASSCLHTVRAGSPWQECLGAAEHIQKLIMQGCRYRDITLVCTDVAMYQPMINMIFNRLHIPVYQAGTEDILRKSVIHTVLSAMDAALSGFDQRTTLRYLRSALSPVDPDMCDEVENYVILWGIRGRRWSEEWEMHPDGLDGENTAEAEAKLEALNLARRNAVLPLFGLKEQFQNAAVLKDQVVALYNFLEEIQMGDTLSSMAQEYTRLGDDRSAQILNQLWEILMSALEQLYDVLGDTYWEPEYFVRLLRLLLSQYDVGTIPPVLDAVQMGPVSAMRCHQQKHLILLGAQEGNLPAYSGSAGVLTDQERVMLRSMGVPLTGGSMEGIQAEFAEIYGVFCGAMETVCVFCSGEQPSFIFRRLCELSGSVEAVTDTFGFAPADRYEAGIWLAGWNAEDVAQKLNAMEGYKAAQRSCAFSLGAVSASNLRGLYGNTLNLSASQIDTQAECRLSYFLKYGLRARERKEITIDPAEFGTYVHAVLENTARCIRDMGGFRAVTLDQTLEIAHRFSEEYARERFSQIQSERMEYLFRRNAMELDMVVAELWAELQESLFEPREFEVKFGGSQGLPPIAVPNSSMNAILRGFIDRVDTWHTNGNDYYRVVDYKTGKKDFDYCDVFNGVGLQMLLYMFALRSSGEDILGDNPIAAGVQYFPARSPYLPSDGKLTEDDAAQARMGQWKRKGLLLNDETVLQAMEPGDSPKRMSYSIKKDGSLSGDLADREDMKLLEKYVFHILSGMVEDIASGNVEPNPYTRGTSHNACAFCPYSSVCHSEYVEGRRNYKAMTAQRFWDEIRKEMGNRG